MWSKLEEDNDSLQPGAMEAMMKAFQACDYVSSDPAKAVQMAETALEITHGCPEAFNVLAQCKATSLDEAFDLYTKAEEASRQMLKDHEARVKFRTGKMWDDLHLRPLFRAIHGQANTLRKMGRYREALAKYLLLEKYDSNWYTTRATYANYRYHMPAVYLALGNTEAASRYLARWAEQGYSLSSTSLCWHFTRALLDFKMSARPRACEMGEYIRYADDAGKASLIKAVQNAPAVLPYLAGRKAMPGGRLPLSLLSAGSLCAAVSYVRAYGDLWRQTPGAIEWAQKNANTFFALLLFREKDLDQALGEGNKVLGLKRDVASLRRLCFENGGIYPNERIDFNGATLLMEALHTPHIPHNRKAPFVRVLLEAGCDPSLCDTDGLNAVHKACYYELDTECLKALLETGFDACADDPSAPVPSPMLMTLNQGNWRSTEIILASLPKDSPYLRQEHLFRWYGELGRSGVYFCLRGGTKCSRCRQDPMPHTRDPDTFERAVDVLLRYGLNPTFAIDREMAKHPLHRYAKAQATRHKASRGNKAAPATGKPAATIKATATPAGKTKARTGTATGAAAGAGTNDKKKQSCARCGKTANKACGGCKLVWYCSRECQSDHWQQSHKAACSKVHLNRAH